VNLGDGMQMSGAWHVSAPVRLGALKCQAEGIIPTLVSPTAKELLLSGGRRNNPSINLVI
jgi:hypothetical protein